MEPGPRPLAPAAAGAPPAGPDAAEALIDAALAAVPLSTLPGGFNARAMARIAATPQLPVLTRPRLTFLDWLLPALAGLLALLGGIVLLSAPGAEPLATSRLLAWGQTSWATLLPGVPQPGPALLPAIAAGIGVLVLAVVTLTEGRHRAR